MVSDIVNVPKYGFPSEAAAQFPSCVQLTLAHYICDSSCLSCPVGRLNRGDMQAKKLWEASGAARYFMPWEVFIKAADETGQYPHAFMRFHARGEPTLHPRFVDMIAYAKNAGVRIIQVFTNGISMDASLAEATLRAGLDVIEFSIHGHTQTYAELMGNDKYEQVVANVIRFVELRNALGATTKVVVSAVDQPGFQSEKVAHNRFWAQYVDQVILRPYHSWGGRILREEREITVERHPCPQLWTRLTVGPTGKVLFCYNSWDESPSDVVADLMEPTMTIAQIWQSERYNQARADHLAGRYTLGCCARCVDWVGSAWGENSYEALLRKLNIGSTEGSR